MLAITADTTGVPDALKLPQTFKTSCSSLQISNQAVTPATVFGTGPTLVRSAADTWKFTANGVDTNFVPADKVAATTGSSDVIYRHTTSAGAVEILQVTGPVTPLLHIAYTRRVVATVAGPGGALSRHECVLGVPTLATDLPTTEADIALEPMNLTGNGVISGGANAGTYVFVPGDSKVTAGKVNTKNNTLVLTIELKGRKVVDSTVQTTVVDLGTYTTNATITPASTSFYGALTSSNRDIVAAQIAGWSFGPRMTETGYSFSIQSREPGTTNQLTATGTAIVLRKPLPTPTPTSSSTPTT
ncbi:hypothetical protein GRI97_12115 [Altererythrobacter xixiisoli]|uniref:Uncharacterized protein n=1 Tax=Croceibacterium xixiisoli TaxID=1476466 RepID=A0A6I4TUU5_9SPHN|nr:hypothetical protein [Croceibacterium xixiisoli]MXO99734.1 hypothetical protein [Croceibacterium xixiisoli]